MSETRATQTFLGWPATSPAFRSPLFLPILPEMEASEPPTRKNDPRPAWGWPALLLGAFLMFTAGTGLLPLMDRDEPRFAEASREMLESGNWIVPHLNGRYRFDKPPMIYWLQAGCIVLLGPSELAVRLPSAICATLTAGLLALWGRRLAGDRAGMTAALIWVTCPQAFVHAHLAVADMVMVFFFTLSCWSGWELHQAGKDKTAVRIWHRVFFVSLALGFLAKGPVAWLAALPAILLAWGRLDTPSEPPSPWRQARLWWTGGLLAFGLVALWGIPALVDTQGEFFQVGIGKHVVARSVGVLEGHGLKGLRGYLGSLPFYPLMLMVGFLPWSPWLVRSLWKRRSSGPLSPIDRYLATSVLGVFVVFTLIRTKLPHYTLPAFPLIALWLGKTIAGAPGNARWIRRLTVGTAATLMIVAIPGLGFFARMLPVPRLAQECRRWIDRDSQLATFEFHEPSLYWYLRPNGGPWIRHLDDESAVLEFLAQPGSRACVLPYGEVFRHAVRRYPKLVTVSAEGFNPANGKHVELRALIKKTVP